MTIKFHQTRKLFSVTLSAVVFLAINISLSICCDESLFKCDNKDGNCLPVERMCDGVFDCFDKSDETADVCIQQKCPPFSYQCSYGACIPESARCNGTTECADGSDELPTLCSKNYSKDNSLCMNDEFACNSGECIALEDVCDGHVNCLDRSDETVEICASLNCDMFFRCGYGACIPSDKKCDGLYDCADGSDESSKLCMGILSPPVTRIPNKTIRPTTPTPQPTTELVPLASSDDGCVIPDIKNSHIVLEANLNKNFKAGERVPNREFIVYQCKRGFFREGPEFNLCSNGTWFSSIHSVCIQYCPHEVLIGITFVVKCVYNGSTVPCDNRIRPGTIAIVTCPTKYRIPDHNPIQTLLCTENGQWDYPPSRCEPICGDELIPSVPFLTNADTTNITAVPWHVGIYILNDRKYKHNCGGTLISAKAAISAAHCFWDTARKRIYENSLFVIGAGKFYRDFYKQESNAQISNISQIAVPEEYTGEDSKYKADIAVVILVNPLIFSEFISPICIQWQRAGGKAIKSGSYGQIAGWGKTETGGFSDTLKTITVPASSNEACKNEVDSRYADSITDDKFCIVNRFNMNACQGDSGGGFAMKKEIGGRNRYFLWGIVSAGVPLGLTCVNYQFVSYTNIQYYENFITDLEIRNRPK